MSWCMKIRRSTLNKYSMPRVDVSADTCSAKSCGSSHSRAARARRGWCWEEAGARWAGPHSPCWSTWTSLRVQWAFNWRVFRQRKDVIWFILLTNHAGYKADNASEGTTIKEKVLFKKLRGTWRNVSISRPSCFSLKFGWWHAEAFQVKQIKMMSWGGSLKYVLPRMR